MNSILETVKKERLLRGIALDVFEIITGEANQTIGEIAKKYQALRPKFKRGRNEIAKRVRDLETWGAVQKNGADVCSVTGKKVAMYKVTGKLPNRYAVPVPARKATLSPIDVSALLEKKNVEIAAVKKNANEVAEKATALMKKANVLKVAVEGNVSSVAALKAVRAEKLSSMTAFFKSKATRAKIRKEIEAIDFALRTLQAVEELSA